MTAGASRRYVPISLWGRRCTVCAAAVTEVCRGTTVCISPAGTR